ncbi:MAG: peptidyl-prolyl cis-trans isomerase [Gammaproteobacteria bacterium]|jgi:cyclophilin family peptidyl-prolyl cis-trans isomerase|nr:peptidyl-prolyl cis-trans isomerase [Gammaproteobacteria bacterium]MBT3488585.1 peptidyl-prolyl cis-trans isomerase [Gammaproteobacteria bacterium]MBT3718976.1 peptidyl-prolyl cis-trans isomerase [Gammaproteobacteria bacterium]MBT3846225.1 peptidyl-prolyl cis-trans isomerase [Gammaproteobacteria bacterium]MBT3893970.1 peptidyl-prolyl cis-trans isomerase [Gammaproteobacteria bacterium]
MKKNLTIFGSVVALLGAVLFTVVPSDPAVATEENPLIAADSPLVELVTNYGNITLQLDAARAPFTVTNFLTYVKSGHYDGTIFHRVIPRFMIQGGGFTLGFDKKPTHDMIPNEADNGLKNLFGTVAMARTGDPHSATAQFFINTTNNRFLNHTRKSQRGWGYTVFGKVINGIEVVRQIEQTKTGPGGPFQKDAPVEMVIIELARLISK